MERYHSLKGASHPKRGILLKKLLWKNYIRKLMNFIERYIWERKEKWVEFFLFNGVTFDLLHSEIHEWIVIKDKELVEIIYKNITCANRSNI